MIQVSGAFKNQRRLRKKQCLFLEGSLKLLLDQGAIWLRVLGMISHLRMITDQW